MSAPVTEQNTNSAVSRQTFTTQDLRSISSVQDLQRLFADKGVTVRDATHEIGDGFSLLDDKDALIGKPFYVISWSFAKGDYDDDFVVMRVVSESGKHVVTDGSTGIREQMRDYQAAIGGGSDPLFVARGLRKSEYEYQDENGQTKPAKTYYLSV